MSNSGNRLTGRAATFCLLATLCAGSLLAQPTVGVIEIFGAQKVPRSRIEKALGVRVGHPVPKSRGDAEMRIADVPDVLAAQVEGFCCYQGKVILYVGIEEKGRPSFEHLPEPQQEIVLPDAIAQAYRDFTAAVEAAARANDTDEDLSRGHSLMKNSAAQQVQLRLIELAEAHEAELRRILRNAADPEQRAMAALVLGYVKDKSVVVDDLQLGMRDIDDGVRRNAARSLKAIAVLGASDPELRIRVQPTWFVEMLNSTSLSDRLEATNSLLYFTEKPNAILTDYIRERALPSLYEMAAWTYLPHALPAYLLLGRIAGKTDQEMQESWSNGEREAMIQLIRRPKKNKN